LLVLIYTSFSRVLLGFTSILARKLLRSLFVKVVLIDVFFCIAISVRSPFYRFDVITGNK